MHPVDEHLRSNNGSRRLYARNPFAFERFQSLAGRNLFSCLGKDHYLVSGRPLVH